MFTHKASADNEILTPNHALLADQIGNEVYASHYAERKAYRLILGCVTALLLGSMWLNFSLATRPLVNRYIRINAMGRAQAIQYSDLNFTPRDGEVRTYLTQWANYRYTISPATIATKYPLNYYFLSQSLAARMMTKNNRDHLVSKVMSGDITPSDARVRDVTITSMSIQKIHRRKIARGTALVVVDRIYSPAHSRNPRTEHWMISVTYYLNPAQVSRQAQIFPQFETINPLGLTITQFHANEVSVDPLVAGGNPSSSAGVTP